MRKAPDVIDWVSEMKAKGEPFALAPWHRCGPGITLIPPWFISATA